MRALLCLLGGALGALALPPVSWPVFFFPGFMLLVFYLQESRGWSETFLLSFLYALGYHVAGLYWISASLFIDIARYVWVLPFSALALPCWLALLFGLGALAACPFRKKPVAHTLFLTVTLFFSEILRGFLLTGFPWNLFGEIWSEFLPLAQSVSLFGIYGLTLLTLLTAAASTLLLRPWTRPSLSLVTLCWLALSSLALWGVHRLEKYPSAFDTSVNLRIVQPGIMQEERRTYEQRLAALSRLAKYSMMRGDAPITHLLWPETAVPDFLTSEPDLRVALARIVPKNGVLITGAPTKSQRDHKIFYANSLAVLDERGTVMGLYDKHHLVPFGEFIPLRTYLKMMPVATDVIGSRADFTPGPGPRTLRAPHFPSFSPLICYEAIFSGKVIDKNDPPDLLLQITNDAWFGNTSGPYQHFAQARLRAIEEGLPLIRAANTGISASVDPVGRVMNALPLGHTGFIDTHLPKRLPGKTLFFQFRNRPAFVLALFLLITSLIYLFSPFRKR